jgi:large subunit ribosomal protein L23
MKDPHQIIVKPHITERTVKMSYGDPRIRDEKDIVRKYTFIVSSDATKIEVKAALEAMYNEGRKKADWITISSVNTVTVHGKLHRVRTKRGQFPTEGKKPDVKKAIVTLGKGQILEDYGV